MKRNAAEPAERRGARRYGLTLPARWTLYHGAAVEASGEGATIDVSGSGILFDAGRQLPIGREVAVFVDWPAHRQGGVRVELTIFGSITRSEGGRAAVQTKRQMFVPRARTAERKRETLFAAFHPQPSQPFVAPWLAGRSALQGK